MDKIEHYRQAIQEIICDLGKLMPSTDEVETQYIFDTERDHYQLFQVGWEEFEWTHACILHIDIKNQKIWIQHNGTEIDIAQQLLDKGIEKNNIVLGFHAPYKRKYTEFAEV